MYRGDFNGIAREAEGKSEEVNYHIFHGQKEGACHQGQMLLGGQDEIGESVCWI